jgi:hypothetical protein
MQMMQTRYGRPAKLQNKISVLKMSEYIPGNMRKAAATQRLPEISKPEKIIHRM